MGFRKLNDRLICPIWVSNRHSIASFRVSGVPWLFLGKVIFRHTLSGGYELHTSKRVQLKLTSMLCMALWILYYSSLTGERAQMLTIYDFRTLTIKHLNLAEMNLTLGKSLEMYFCTYYVSRDPGKKISNFQ